MKKLSLKLSALAFVGALAFSSCSKEDTSAPTITIKGDAVTVIYLNDNYVDAGATATDQDAKDETTDLTSKIVVTSNVDKTKAGDYTVKYNVSDEAGNAATEITRKVTVKHNATTVAGAFSQALDCSNGTGTVSSNIVKTSTELDIKIGNLGDLAAVGGTPIDVDAKLSGSYNEVVTLVAGTYSGTQVNAGTGSISSDGKTLTITSYTISNSGSSFTCKSTFTK